MGDSGSMLIGLMLAAATTSASGRVETRSTGPSDTLALLSPLLVVAAGCLLIVASAWFLAFTPAFSLLPLPLGAFRAWMALFAATLLTRAVPLVRAGVLMHRSQHTAVAVAIRPVDAAGGRW